MANNKNLIQERLPILQRIKTSADKYLEETGKKPKFVRLGVREKDHISTHVRMENLGKYITDKNIEEMMVGGMALSFTDKTTAIDLAHKEGHFLSLCRTSFYFLGKSDNVVSKIRALN